MAEDINERVPHKRRRKQQTDYQQRRKLLKSGKPRAVVRTSNQHTRVHLAHFETEGDKNTAQTISKQLGEYGWEHHTGNLPAAYLTGFLAGMKADADEAVLDLGLREKKDGGRVFAAVQGMNDAGMEVPVGEEALPEEGRMKGEHIKEMKDIDVPSSVEEVKENIRGDFN
ncbi:50S ribosomal protein L18 [Candidatus Nanohalobium constans]|uniref:Large ribosomal subunit protein uL18 n=1 Tax=Candidatus Nanohalobium constans TaxID=2565781 RepID=A0A5Q0UJ34_9ARCH|nr:50S ribosomal protein L18 [Candidatus Nanohalobium constans]QGA80965.1 50S ribosomal protein L18 [Candidatus Nanohalobium constans]